MRTLFFALFALLAFLPARAQDPTEEKAKVKMTMSPAYENDKRRTFIRSMMRDKTGNVYLVKIQYKIFGKSELVIEKYAADLRQQFSKELIIAGTDGKDLDFHSASTINGEPHAFSSFYNKSKDKRYFFISKIEPNGIIGKPKKIAELDTDSRNDGGFSVHFSADSSKMLVVVNQDTKRKEKVKFAFNVYDNTLNQVWEANVVMPFETRDVLLSDYEVDNQGRVFVLATVDNDDKKSKKDADVIQQIFMYENGAAKEKRYNLDLKGKLITGLRLHEDKGGDLIAVGTYASTHQKNAFFSRDRISPLGTVFVKIKRESGEIATKSVNQFKAKTFDFFKVTKSKVEDGKGIPNMRLERSWIGDDGNINLDLEQNYVIVTQSRQGAMTTYHYHYYSELAMLIKLGADGKPVSEVIIPKKMTSTDDETGLRHVLTHIGANTYYVFNDSPKNWGRKLEDESDLATGVSPESGGLSFKKKPHVVLCTVDKDGNRSFARLFSYKDDDVFLNTESSLPYSDKSFIVVASYNKDFKLVKIEF